MEQQQVKTKINKKILDKLTLEFFKKKIKQIALIKEDKVQVEFAFDTVISAIYPRIVYKLSNGAYKTLEDMYADFPVAKRILEEEVVVKVEEYEDFMLNYGAKYLNLAKEPETVLSQGQKLLTKQYPNINQYKGVKSTDLIKEYNLNKRNIKQLEKNLKVIQENDYYTIVNYEHDDNDICDSYIGLYFTKADLIAPPYHPNCKCDVQAVTKEEYMES